VFCTKYRRSVITRRAFDRLRFSMKQTSQQIGIDIIAVQSDGNHLHLMVLYPPRLDLSTIVKRLKGASSRFIRSLRLPEVLKQLWGRHFWSPSYFVVSCGGAPLDVVKTYVDSQNDPDTKRRKAASRPVKPKRKSYPQAEVRGLRILDG